MGRTIAQALIEDGVEKGIIQTKQEYLIELIRFRFQNISPEVDGRIRNIRDVDRLTAIFRRALSANSISELVQQGESF